MCHNLFSVAYAMRVLSGDQIGWDAWSVAAPTFTLLDDVRSAGGIEHEPLRMIDGDSGRFGDAERRDPESGLDRAAVQAVG